MNRITPAMVRLAYETSGLIPIRSSFAKFIPPGKLCGCAMTALWLVRDPGQGDSIDRKAVPGMCKPAAWSLEQFGEMYRNGFCNAWDHAHAESLVDSNADYKQGFVDGAACAKEVFGEMRITPGLPLDMLED